MLHKSRLETMLAWIILGLWYASSAHAMAPAIEPQFDDSKPVMDLTPLLFTVIDVDDPEPTLDNIKLSDSEGSLVAGVNAQWGKRCPEGFSPSKQKGMCEKVVITQREPYCQDGFTLAQNENWDDVCQKVESVPAVSACSSGFALNSEGNACELYQTRPAAPDCPTGWTLDDDSCNRTLERSPEVRCPEGFSLAGKECTRNIEVPATSECPPGSEANGNTCSSIVHSPAIECPRGSVLPSYGFGGRGCAYETGVMEAPSSYGPKEKITCSSGYALFNGSCRKQSSAACSKYSRITVGDNPVSGASGYASCGFFSADGNCPAGTQYASSFMYGECHSTNYLTCPAGTTRAGGNCYSNSTFPPKTLEQVCTNGWGGWPATEYSSGKCWYKNNYYRIECPDGYEMDVPEGFNQGTYAGESICVAGGSATRGSLCDDGYTFNGDDAVCAEVVRSDATAECADGFVADGSECKKIDETSPELSCPDGFSAQGTKCVKENVRPKATCPAGYENAGATCTQTTKIQAESEFSCPSGTIPNFCSFTSMGATQWYGNIGDENLSVAEQQAACESYTRDGIPGVLTPISSNTQCSAPFKQSTGPGYHCSQGICSTATAEKHFLSWGDEAQSIGLSSTCPVGYSLQAEMCVKQDVLDKCPQGWSLKGDQCVVSTTMDIEVNCPSGYFADGNVCRLISYKPFEYSCPEGTTLQGDTCYQVSESGPYTGEGCPEGEIVFGGSCETTEAEPVSAQCVSGYMLVNGTCKKTETKSHSYTCGEDPTWSLQSTTCWRTITEPTATECPDGSWSLEGADCKRTTVDKVNRVCPDGYSQSAVYYDECFKTDTVDNIQGNHLTVTIPKVWPGSYTLELNVSNKAGDKTTELFDLLFHPQMVKQRSGSDELRLPAANHAFHWSDGADTFVTEPIGIDGDMLIDARPIYAGVRRNAGSAFSINGVIVEPGEYKEVHSSYDFSLTDSVLELPIFPIEIAEASNSDLIISIGSSGQLASMISIDAWVFDGGVRKSRTSPVRIFDEVKIEAVENSNAGCSLEANANQSKSTGALNDALCFIEWITFPKPLEPASSGAPELNGTIDHEGPGEISYIASIFDRDGTKVQVGEVESEIIGGSAMNVVDYDVKENFSTVYHTVQDIRMSLVQTNGPNCRLTVDEEYAISFATRGSRVKFCYLEWEHLPGTLEQEPQSITPEARGRVFYAGQYQASFKVYAYTSIGTPVLVQDKTIQFEAVDPPAPSVETVGGEEIASNLFPVAARGGKVLDVKIAAENASLRVTEFLDGSAVEEDVFPALPWQDKFRNYQRIALDQSPLWTRSTHEVDAQYTDLPDVRGSVIFDSLSVPGDEVRPILSTEGRVALNDDVLTMNIGIRDIYNQDLGYDATTMGQWDVRVVQQEAYNTNTAITGWSSIDAEGNATVPLNLQELDINSGVLRLYAEARVKSPVPQYSRTVTSSQPVTITVLYGGQIDAELDARYIAGEAPFRTVFKVELSNRDLYAALGDVEWYISDQNQQNWEKLENTNRNPRVFDYIFEEGIYFVKAKLLNRNSEAQTETPPLKVISYNKPTLEVDGPSVVFVGDTVDLQASVGFDGQPLQPEDVVIQWSEDGGDSWQDGGFDYTLTREGDEVGRVRLYTRARMPNAPADDRNAWTDNKGSVEFRTVRPPRTYIYGPRVAEVGKEHKYEVYLGLPYARMDYEVKGFFTMPDGTIVQGETAYFTPTREQLADTYAFVKYTAYIEGWREQGAEQVRDQRIRLWEYKFPEFQMSGRYSATVAPAEGTLYVRPLDFRGRLENPVYTWDFPAGVTVVEDRNPIARKVMFNEPGTYPVKVTITDDRGNEAIVEERLTFGEPEPYNADFVIGGDRTHIRAPYEILVKPNVSGGHPRDYIVDRKYFLNGELMDSYGSYGQAVLDAGTSTIRMDVTSKFGETASKEKKFTVNENRPPVCMLEKYDRLDSWMLRADCSDPDGNVKTHSWWINGQKVSLSGYRISIPKDNENAIEVQLSALDDSGDESDKTTLTIEPPEDPPQP